MKKYEKNQLENLVKDCPVYGYQIQVYDGYGNKTNWLRINSKQLEEIAKIIINETNNETNNN